LKGEKEDEHFEMGTTGSDSVDDVSHTSCSQECEDCSDNGTDSEADCFSTISLEDDAVQCEEEEGLEMEINGTLDEIEDGSLDDVNEDVDPANHLKPPKERSIAHST
jgi:hypothetical protein